MTLSARLHQRGLMKFANFAGVDVFVDCIFNLSRNF
jgi:hypothetical protein